jgi:hypothetical protein
MKDKKDPRPTPEDFLSGMELPQEENSRTFMDGFNAIDSMVTRLLDKLKELGVLDDGPAEEALEEFIFEKDDSAERYMSTMELPEPEMDKEQEAIDNNPMNVNNGYSNPEMGRLKNNAGTGNRDSDGNLMTEEEMKKYLGAM